MSWDEIGAVGQVLGSVAVFITLGYLALQVRHARDAVRSSVRQARADATRDVLLAMATHSDLAASTLALDTAMGIELPFERFAIEAGLTPVQARQVWIIHRATWEMTEASIESMEHQSADQRAAFDQRNRVVYAMGRNSKWYELNERHPSPTAVRYVDNLLAQPR